MQQARILLQACILPIAVEQKRRLNAFFCLNLINKVKLMIIIVQVVLWKRSIREF